MPIFGRIHLAYRPASPTLTRLRSVSQVPDFGRIVQSAPPEQFVVVTSDDGATILQPVERKRSFQGRGLRRGCRRIHLIRTATLNKCGPFFRGQMRSRDVRFGTLTYAPRRLTHYAKRNRALTRPKQPTSGSATFVNLDTKNIPQSLHIPAESHLRESPCRSPRIDKDRGPRWPF